jgi:hypothetical protein
MVGILVRIDEMKKGYKCYILVLKKAILSKDVVIDESTKFTFHLESIEHKEDEKRKLRLRGSFPPLNLAPDQHFQLQQDPNQLDN